MKKEPFIIESCVQCHHADMSWKRCSHPDFTGVKFYEDWEKIWTEFGFLEGCPLKECNNEL